MALINNPNLTQAIQQELVEASERGAIDTATLTSIINQFLPPNEQLARGVGVTTGVYKRFGEFDKVDARTEVVTTGLWSGDKGQLTEFYTSSVQVTPTPSNLSGNYFYNVYDKDPSVDDTAEVQFAVAYGHVDGTGSLSLTQFPGSTLASKAVYSQYRSLLLPPGDERFTFISSSAGLTVDSDDIYVVNLGRARFREKMDPQNWELVLSGSNGSFKFIDDSGKKFDDDAGRTGNVFNIVVGDLNIGTSSPATITETTAANGEGYGLFYPQLGLLIFNPSAIDTKVGSLTPVVATGTGIDDDAQNHKLLFEAIERGENFTARRTENIQTQHFFCRATNREFNFSNNPTYYDAQTGDLSVVGFDADPKTYITTVGLYNDSNELIAVAKSSRPIQKSFSRETLLKVKLEF